jgi:hypothetical protein
MRAKIITSPFLKFRKEVVGPVLIVNFQAVAEDRVGNRRSIEVIE